MCFLCFLRFICFIWFSLFYLFYLFSLFYFYFLCFLCFICLNVVGVSGECSVGCLVGYVRRMFIFRRMFNPRLVFLRQTEPRLPPSGRQLTPLKADQREATEWRSPDREGGLNILLNRI